jgi:hypothetical protein
LANPSVAEWLRRIPDSAPSEFGHVLLAKQKRSRVFSLRDDQDLEILVVNEVGREIRREFVRREPEEYFTRDRIRGMADRNA